LAVLSKNGKSVTNALIQYRSLTEGWGTFTMEFDRYEEVPASIAQEIIEGKRR
jgi:translation elongation factor EF-G